MLTVLWQTKNTVSFLLKIEMGSGGWGGGLVSPPPFWSGPRPPGVRFRWTIFRAPNPESVHHCRNVKLLRKNVRSHLYANDKLVEP